MTIKNKSEEIFYEQVKNILLERSHNKDFINSLIYKVRADELNKIVSSEDILED